MMFVLSIVELLLLFTNLSCINLNFPTFWFPLLTEIANYFDTRILSDLKYPHLSVLFFKNLAVDLEAVDGFFRNLPDKNDSNFTFDSPISPLLELCSLLRADSVHEYLDPVVRGQKYSHVKAERIVKVLGRVKEPAEQRKSVEDLILLLK